jgi:predicted RNA-binding protein with PIN domain
MIQLIVDANNILKNARSDRFAKIPFESSKLILLDTLNEFSIYYGFDVTVVFDGKGDAAKYGNSKNVSVVYSGRGRDADTIIEQLLFQNQDSSACSVLTDDRMLSDIARGAGATVMKVSDFIAGIDRMKRENQDFLYKRRLQDKIRHL